MNLTDEEKRERLRKRAETVRDKHKNRWVLEAGEMDAMLLAIEALAFLANKEDYYKMEGE